MQLNEEESKNLLLVLKYVDSLSPLPKDIQNNVKNLLVKVSPQKTTKKNLAYINQPDYGNDFVESVVRTNKLYCSGCGSKIKKGDNVTFELNWSHKMEGVYCHSCSEADDYMQVGIIESNRHPFDLED